MHYQSTCTKGNQKLTLSLQANSLEEARSILHAQGYSIMDIRESLPGDTNSGNFFYFDTLVNGVIKTGKIQSDDIFKAYKKLIEDLGYSITSIYTTEGMSEDQKKIMTSKVQDGYTLYLKSQGIDTANRKVKTEKEEDISEISPQVLKELAHYNDIVDSTIEKIQNLLIKYHNTLSGEKRKSLESQEMILAQAKGGSNLGKLKNIVENALTELGALEKELIQGGMEGEKKILLEETNNLLKQIGSSNRIDTTSDDDIAKKITLFFEKYKKKSEEVSQNDEQKKKIDTNSFVFYRNLRELNIYRQLLKQNRIRILKALFSFQFSDVKRLFLKQKLLSQNITIIDNRIHNRNISYSKVVRGAQYYFDILFGLFEKVSDLFLYSLFLYTFSMILLSILEFFGYKYFQLDVQFIFYITLFSAITITFLFFRSIVLLFLFLIFFVYYFVFLSVNF